MSPSLVRAYRMLKPNIAFWSVSVTKLTYFNVSTDPGNVLRVDIWAEEIGIVNSPWFFMMYLVD